MVYDKKLRHELKYIINEVDLNIMRNRLKHIMRIDTNTNSDGRYVIGSIYFDDLRSSAFYQKIDGINERCKFRIRAYNHNNSYIVLERKSKYSGLTQKVSAELSYEQFNNIMEGEINFLTSSRNQLLREFYNKLSLNRLKPCQLVEYVREPYIYAAGNVRITFDMNLRSTANIRNSLFDFQKSTVPALEKGFHILEIKYDEFLPEHIRNILQINNRQAQACSKYVLCRLATANYN